MNSPKTDHSVVKGDEDFKLYNEMFSALLPIFSLFNEVNTYPDNFKDMAKNGLSMTFKLALNHAYNTLKKARNYYLKQKVGEKPDLEKITEIYNDFIRNNRGYMNELIKAQIEYRKSKSSPG